MLPYARFQNEADFREQFVKPLLNRLGFYGVSEQHGTQEFGKDFVFSELHRLGGVRHYAAQVKHEERIGQGKSVDGLLSQVRQAFANPFRRPDSPRDCYVSGVYIINSGEITANAKEQLLSELERERYGDNVYFLDGERLEGLNEWGFLQTDATARARLTGLRSALRYNIRVLNEAYIKGKSVYVEPIYVHGIEAYLSEPVNCSDELLAALFQLLLAFKQMEGIRESFGSPNKAMSDARARIWPALVRLAESTLPIATLCLSMVEAAIEKMKPLY